MNLFEHRMPCLPLHITDLPNLHSTPLSFTISSYVAAPASSDRIAKVIYQSKDAKTKRSMVSNLE